MLGFILQNVPPHWEEEEYRSNKVYSLHQVKPATEEWKTIESKFRTTPERIVRVQNPFTYGQFFLQKKEVENMTGHHTREIVLYQEVKIKDVEVAVEYNCNYRRIEGMSETFLTSPPDILTSDKAVLVIQALKNPPPKISYYYVNYVVYFD